MYGAIVIELNCPRIDDWLTRCVLCCQKDGQGTRKVHHVDFRSIREYKGGVFNNITINISTLKQVLSHNITSLVYFQELNLINNRRLKIGHDLVRRFVYYACDIPNSREIRCDCSVSASQIELQTNGIDSRLACTEIDTDLLRCSRKQQDEEDESRKHLVQRSSPSHFEQIRYGARLVVSVMYERVNEGAKEGRKRIHTDVRL